MRRHVVSEVVFSCIRIALMSHPQLSGPDVAILLRARVKARAPVWRPADRSLHGVSPRDRWLCVLPRWRMNVNVNVNVWRPAAHLKRHAARERPGSSERWASLCELAVKCDLTQARFSTLRSLHDFEGIELAARLRQRIPRQTSSDLTTHQRPASI
jgi:phytoene dehydrogenase-like protein